MLENEDSVVTSLNELRKLKHERITRQTQSRAVVGAGRAAALAVDPMSDQMTPPPALAVAQSAQLRQVPAHGGNGGFGAPGSHAGAFSAPAPTYVQSPPIIQTKTSYAAAVVVGVLLVGAGGAGYMKLQSDTQAIIAAKDLAIKRAEESRMAAAEGAAKADVQARNNLRQCEDKLKLAMAAAPAPAMAAAVAPLAPAVERKPEKPAVAKAAARPAAAHRVAARPSRRAQAGAEPAAPKTGDVPTIAKKKKLDNDPLAGLGKL
jgi:hypothetical protein